MGTCMQDHPPKSRINTFRWILLPPLDLAPRTEPPHPLLKLKDIQIFTVSHKDSVGNQPAPWAYHIEVQSKPKI